MTDELILDAEQFLALAETAKAGGYRTSIEKCGPCDRLLVYLRSVTPCWHVEGDTAIALRVDYPLVDLDAAQSWLGRRRAEMPVRHEGLSASKADMGELVTCAAKFGFEATEEVCSCGRSIVYFQEEDECSRHSSSGETIWVEIHMSESAESLLDMAEQLVRLRPCNCS